MAIITIAIFILGIMSIVSVAFVRVLEAEARRTRAEFGAQIAQASRETRVGIAALSADVMRGFQSVDRPLDGLDPDVAAFTRRVLGDDPSS